MYEVERDGRKFTEGGGDGEAKGLDVVRAGEGSQEFVHRMCSRGDVYDVGVLDGAWYVKESGGLGCGVMRTEGQVLGCPRGRRRMYVSGGGEVVKE